MADQRTGIPVGIPGCQEGLLDEQEMALIPREVQRVLEGRWRAHQEESAIRYNSTMVAYGNALLRMEEAIRKRDEEIAELKKAGPVEGTLPTRLVRTPSTNGIRTNGIPTSQTRKKNILLKEQLRNCEKRIRESERREKRLDAQVSFLLDSADKERKELVEIMAEQVAEIEKYKQAMEKSPVQTELDSADELLRQLHGMHTEQERLQLAASEAIDKAALLSSENAQLRASMELMGQYELREQAHKTAQSGMERALKAAEAERGLLISRLESTNQQILQDSQFKETLHSALLEIRDRVAQLSQQPAQQDPLLPAIHEKLLNMQHRPDQSTGPLLQHCSSMLAAACGSVDSMKSSLVRASVTEQDLRQFCAKLVDLVEEQQVEISALRREESFAEKPEVPVEQERHNDEYYKNWIAALESQLASYRRDVADIEEKYETYKRLYDGLSIEGLKSEIERVEKENGELRGQVEKKEAYIEKQNELLRKYRAFKEAYARKVARRNNG